MMINVIYFLLGVLAGVFALALVVAGRNTPTLGLLLLLLAIPAAAQDRPITDRSLHPKPYALLVGGQLADVGSSAWAFSRGCHEGNRTAYHSAQPSASELLKTKALMVLPSLGVIYLAQKTGHQTIANWFGGVTGGLGFGAAAYNLTLHCG